jgi:hypothetical protein
MGIHGGANAWYPLGEVADDEGWWINELKAMGFTWVKLLDVEASAVGPAAKCVKAGIQPVVRLYRPTPNPGTLDENTKTKAAVQDLVFAGCNYFETNNEPNVNWEWKGNAIPPDGPQQVARDFIADAEYILNCGGIPLLPAMSPGGHWDDMDFLAKVLQYLKAHWSMDALNRCAIACHNAALNHPLDYPFDAVNQLGAQLTAEDYAGHEWAGSLEQVNEWRIKGRNAGQGLLDPGASNGWLKYWALHSLVLKETGLDLPVLSTEGGIWPGELQDNRYPRVSEQDVVNGYLKIRHQMREGQYPDWYLCTGFWLMANRGMGNPDMSFEYQAWYGIGDYRAPQIEAFKREGPFVRPRAVEPPPPPPPEPTPEPTPTILNDKRVADVCRAAGFGVDLETAIAVVLAESGGDPQAVHVNPDGSRDRGLFQINDKWHPEVNDATAFDPKLAAKAAWYISRYGTDWTPWAAYTSGAYKQYMERARIAAGTGLDVDFWRNLAWNAMGIAYNPDAALARYAIAHNLGLPRSSELYVTAGGVVYVYQVFLGQAGYVVWCRQGDWGNVTHTTI